MKRAYHRVYHKWRSKHLRRYMGEFAGRHILRCEDTIAQMATSLPKRRKQCRSTILRNGTLDTLRRLVTWIGDAMRTKDDVTKWLVREFSFAPATAEADIGNLARAGFLTESCSGLICTRDICKWAIARNDVTTPIRVMHEHIEFIGELLAELRSGPKTTHELLLIATGTYGFSWATRRQIQARLRWLQAAGLVLDEHGSKRVSKAGIAFLSRLNL